MTKIYVIGSLRNPAIPQIGTRLREDTKLEVFDDWFAAGPEADDYWKAYETQRGRSYQEALQGYAAQHVFRFDRFHLITSDYVILTLPAGRSGHLEFGLALGKGKPGYILLDPAQEDRWDVMYQFADMVTPDLDQIITDIRKREG